MEEQKAILVKGTARLIWVPLVCSCCRRRLIGVVRLTPAEPSRELTRRERRVEGITVCLN